MKENGNTSQPCPFHLEKLRTNLARFDGYRKKGFVKCDGGRQKMNTRKVPWHNVFRSDMFRVKKISTLLRGGGGVFLLEVQYSVLKSLISTCVLSYVGSKERIGYLTESASLKRTAGIV